MEKEAFLLLIEKYLQGTASGEEEQRLFRYYETLQTPDSPEDTLFMGDEEMIRKKLFARISAQLSLPPVMTSRLPGQPVVRRLYPRQWAYAAAMVFVSFSITVYLFVNRLDNQPSVASRWSASQPTAHAVGPDRAILALATGEKINLDQRPNGLVAQQGTTQIDKTADGQITYHTTRPATTDPTRYNTLTTLKGAQYQLTLPDGSRVWLNAASSIRFPVVFDRDERRVELSGEAYFEIAPRLAVHPEATGAQTPRTKIPFIVQSANQRVEVLGTQFNVNAYADEPSSRTTLLEGSVRVSQTNRRDERILKPGQQAQVSLGPRTPIRVMPEDVKAVIAWKDGYFAFNDEPLSSIMRKMARWYGVRVVLDPALANQQFTATLSRREPLAKALTMLQLTGAVQFNVDTLPGTTHVITVTVLP